MTKKLIGKYLFGGRFIELYTTDEWGADFTFASEGQRLPSICIGFSGASWEDIVKRLLHEMFEFAYSEMNCRYNASHDYGNDHGGYIFVYNHVQLSDACGRVAQLMAVCLPDLAKAWAKRSKK